MLQITRLRAIAHERVGFFKFMGPHFAGWVPFVAVWAVLTTQFEWSLLNVTGSNPKIPAAVKAIPVVNLVLFCTFGVNQFLGSLNLEPEAHGETRLAMPGSAPSPPVANKRFVWTYMHSECMYTFLSLTTKSLLAWMMYGGSENQADSEKLVSHSLC